MPYSLTAHAQAHQACITKKTEELGRGEENSKRLCLEQRKVVPQGPYKQRGGWGGADPPTHPPTQRGLNCMTERRTFQSRRTCGVSAPASAPALERPFKARWPLISPQKLIRKTPSNAA